MLPGHIFYYFVHPHLHKWSLRSGHSVCANRRSWVVCINLLVRHWHGHTVYTHTYRNTQHTPQGLIDVWSNLLFNSLHIFVMKAACVFSKSKLRPPSFQVKVKYLSCCLSTVTIHCTMKLCYLCT